MVRVPIKEGVTRFLQIGWRKKYHLRELIKLKVTGLRDEHNFEEIIGDMVNVGEIAHSRLNYTTAVN